MTYNEIEKALHCCLCLQEYVGDCDEGCPLLGTDGCRYMLLEQCLVFICRQQSKIKALQMDKEQFESDVINANMNLEHTEEQLTVMTELCRKRQAVIEELQKYYENMENEILSFRQEQAKVKFLKEKIKADAIKDYKERLIFEIVNTPTKYQESGLLYSSGVVNRQNEIIDIINGLDEKEMVGEE